MLFLFCKEKLLCTALRFFQFLGGKTEALRLHLRKCSCCHAKHDEVHFLPHTITFFCKTMYYYLKL